MTDTDRLAELSQGWDEGRAAGPTFPPAPVPAAGLREALVDAMEAHEDGRRGGAYPHLGQTNDIRRFVDWIVDWMEKFTPAALLDSNRPGLDVDVLARALKSLTETQPGSLARADMVNEPREITLIARDIAAEYARLGEAPGE